VRDRERELRREDLLDDPVAQFERWFEEARAEGLPLPQACALATASRDARPSVRMVLLKDVDTRGFSFATNYTSRKGRELAENDSAALLFYWHALGRQVRVEGHVGRVAPEESDTIFAARPRDSRLSALASHQSKPLASRGELEERVRSLADEHQGGEVERPDFWGGYRLAPDAFEFWQHRENRLHIRFAYTRAVTAHAGGWAITELQP
jgi:pyridoxamine 5'-phosphate oxidase